MVFYGCNVENVLYGLCICVECMVLFVVIVVGYWFGDFVWFVVVGDMDGLIVLCGVCC